MVRCRELMTTPSILVKFIELVLCCVCTAVTSGYYVAHMSHNTTKFQVVSGTFTAFLLVSAVICLSYSLEAPLHQYVELAVALTGVIMFLVSSAFMVEAYGWYQDVYHHKNVLVGGLLAIFTAIVFAVDIHLTCRSGYVVVRTESV